MLIGKCVSSLDKFVAARKCRTRISTDQIWFYITDQKSLKRYKKNGSEEPRIQSRDDLPSCTASKIFPLMMAKPTETGWKQRKLPFVIHWGVDGRSSQYISTELLRAWYPLLSLIQQEQKNFLHNFSLSHRIQQRQLANVYFANMVFVDLGREHISLNISSTKEHSLFRDGCFLFWAWILPCHEEVLEEKSP